MKKNAGLTYRFKFVFCAALLVALTGSIYAQPGQPGVFVVPPQVASVSVGLPGVEIHVESDFYEPLAPQGEWRVIGSYGRCWSPRHVARDWRPYCNGNWERTEAGWYWVSDEPWAWATYHYGRWDFTDQYGWYWVPQTQWAPAWVSWHEGGGYVGWAPLQPSVTISVNGYVGFNQARIAPRAFVFVEQRRFLEPIRPTTVVVNNTTIINKTVVINNTRVVNNTVINEGPKTQVMEQVSGRKIQEVPVRELRRKQEAPVVAARTQTAPSNSETKQKSIQPPVPAVVEPQFKKGAAAPAQSQIEKPGVAPRAPAPAPTGRVREGETATPIPAQTERKSAAPRPATVKESAAPRDARYAEPAEKPAKNSEKKVPSKPLPPTREKPVARENNGRAAAEQKQNQKAEERETPREKPAVPPSPSP